MDSNILCVSAWMIGMAKDKNMFEKQKVTLA
jgi:hypothetical protein